MAKRNLNELLAFVTVSREGSFTRAAAVLGVTQSALSQTIRALEERLDIRLLTRTTRSVAPTEAGERLVRAIGPRLEEIEAEVDALTAMRDKPAGTVRITCADHILRTNIWPKLAPLLREYPEVNVEFDVSYGLRDIVRDRFDAGVRLGEAVDQDMIAVPIGPRIRMAAVASPDYFARHAPPTTPSDLTRHRCICQRQVGGGIYAWEFERRGRELEVRIDGQVTVNASPHIVEAALDGLGIAFLPEGEFEPHLEEGRLVRVLDDWCPPFAGYHLYYPSRRHPSPAFSLVLGALRVRETGAEYLSVL
jgi:DNA-binding transcriptional LysR family regulator